MTYMCNVVGILVRAYASNVECMYTSDPDHMLNAVNPYEVYILTVMIVKHT